VGPLAPKNGTITIPDPSSPGNTTTVGDTQIIPLIVSIPQTTGTILNAASVLGNEQDPNSGNNDDQVAVSLTDPIISITKTSDVTGAIAAGDQVTYTITVNNVSATGIDADGTVVSDPVPAGIVSFDSWTCSAAGGAVCGNGTPNEKGSGALSDTVPTFPSGGQLIYTILATVANPVPSTVTNVAGAKPTDPNTVCADGSTPDSALGCTATKEDDSVPTVTIKKTANPSTPSNTTPGGTVTYTIKVSNTGAIADTGSVVSDTLPTGIASATWSCAGDGNATCGSGVDPSKTYTAGDTLTDAPTLPANSSVTYTIVAQVANDNSLIGSSITNTAIITPPSGGKCVPANCQSAAPATPIKSPTQQSKGGVGGGGIAAVPALDARALILLVMLLGGMAWFQRRQARR
jgi:uncharacterized repeat protein (TIGR01451 family)